MENTARGVHKEIISLAAISFGLPLCLSREFTPQELGE